MNEISFSFSLTLFQTQTPWGQRGFFTDLIFVFKVLHYYVRGVIGCIVSSKKIYSSPKPFSSIHSLSHVWLFVTPWTAARQASLSRAYSNYLHWVSDAIQPSSCSVILFSSHLQSSPASGSFQISQFFASGGQSIGVSASASVPPVNTQDCFPLGNPFHSYCFTICCSFNRNILWRCILTLILEGKRPIFHY